MVRFLPKRLKRLRRITAITLSIRDETYKVGSSFYPNRPNSTVKVTRIIKTREGGYSVRNSAGGGTYFASHYVDSKKVVRG